MTNPFTVRFHRQDTGVDLPSYAHPTGDAGADIRSIEDLTIAPGERALVDTGLTIEFPATHAAFIHPRSGLAHRNGVTVLNAPGTIDSNFRGTVKVNLVNLGAEPVAISRGDRIAQIVFQEVTVAAFQEASAAEDLTKTDRGDGGHGSTGR